MTMLQVSSVLPLAVVGVLCSVTACTASPGTTDPYGGLPAPLAGSSVQGAYRGSTSVTVTALGVSVVPGHTLRASAVLNEDAGHVSGVANVEGADGRTAAVLLSGDDQGGRLRLPYTQRACGQDVSFTLYAAINPQDTLNFAGGHHTVTCSGVPVQVTVAPFRAIRQP
jgi:hypothetical protein